MNNEVSPSINNDPLNVEEPSNVGHNVTIPTTLIDSIATETGVSVEDVQKIIDNLGLSKLENVSLDRMLRIAAAIDMAM